jgi:predicted component of type VI protein secretion system
MIVLTVLSYNGERAQGLSAQFDELGGTVGRADNNQLVLPDPERTISRVHARVVYRAGRYAIVDNGSNPISLNGIPVGAGREHPLNPGDEVQIGGYVLQASAAAAATSADPLPTSLARPVSGWHAHTRAHGRHPAAASAGSCAPGRHGTLAAAGRPPPVARTGWPRQRRLHQPCVMGCADGQSPCSGACAGPHPRRLGPVCARYRQQP